MPSKSIRILNFDGSLPRQARLLSEYKPQILDLTRLGPRVRYWINSRQKEEMEKQIQGTAKDSITFLGSGDFHHLSSILINQFREPICVIIFDFHPDWDAYSPRLNCGSWLAQTLKNKNILQCLLVGASSCDISTGNIQSGALHFFKDNRLQIYPYEHKPSSVFLRRVPENISLKLKKGFLHRKIYWHELKGTDLIEFMRSLVGRLPTRKVYLSIDKDCLKKEYALTNWEEGLLRLDELLGMLKIIKENLDIVGVDIAGDYSKIRIDSKFKAVVSRWDHPKDILGKKLLEPIVTATNELTNLKLLEILAS